MTHEQLWRALDTLAAEKGLSPSGLARLAGLDPTSFNRSKRRGLNGPRWPSTESLARVLDAAGIGLDAFATLVSGARVLPSGQFAWTVPVLLLSSLTGMAPDPDELASAATRMAPPAAATDGSYLVRIDQSIFTPALRLDDLLLLSPAATVADGDRVLAFDGRAAIACQAASPLPRRLDTGEALSAPPVVVHRITWIGC